MSGKLASEMGFLVVVSIVSISHGWPRCLGDRRQASVFVIGDLLFLLDVGRPSASSPQNSPTPRGEGTAMDVNPEEKQVGPVRKTNCNYK